MTDNRDRPPESEGDDSAEATAISRRRGKWSEPGVPHRGWTCVSEYDAVESNGDLITCDMCETMQVRFVHVMDHPLWPEQLHCGCICSAHMAEDLTSAKDREARMRSRAARRRKFAKRKGWRPNPDTGGEYLATKHGHILIERLSDGQYRIRAKAPHQGSHSRGPGRYATLQDAKAASFAALEYVEAQWLDYLRKRISTDRSEQED